MDLPIVIGIVVIVIVVVITLVLVVLRATRTRSAKSDWLGELSEIRRSSLGDDEEVTGAMEAVSVDDEVPDGKPTGTASSSTESSGTVASRTESSGTVSRSTESFAADDDPGKTKVDADDDHHDARRDSADDDATSSVGLDGSGEPLAKPVRVTGTPARTFEDAGTVFNDYVWPGFARLRVDATDPRGLRVMEDRAEHPRSAEAEGPGDPPRQVIVDLPSGVLWFRSEPTGTKRACSIRMSAGWVLAKGDLLVLASATEWSYVMCLEGEATILSGLEGTKTVMQRGQIGRVRLGTAVCDVVDVGAAALESEGVVRRQRRLDGRTVDSSNAGN